MAMSYPLQSALPTCKHHLNEELNYYCQTCNLRVCEECLQGRHANHRWMSNKRFARLVRENTGASCEELEEMIRGLEIGNEDMEMEADIDRIEDVRRKWIQAINDRADMLKEKRRAGKSSKISTEEFAKMKKMLIFFNKDIIEADDNVAVEMEEEFHRRKLDLSFNSKTLHKKLSLMEGKLSPDVINYMFGGLVDYINQSKIKVTEKTSFTFVDDSNNIDCIFPFINDEALIERYNDHLYHIDVTGNIKNKFSCPSGYFTVLDKDIFITVCGGMRIRRVTLSGTESDICSTAPLYPAGICKSYDGGLLVTLCSYNKHANITPDTYGEVHHIDISDGIVKKYTHKENSNSKLFIHPIGIAQNTNTDLCVVEYIDRDGTSRLVCVSIASQIRFDYTGQPDLKERFSCNDIACDHHGRILLVDVFNHAVHLLREDGHFLQYVLTEQSPLWGPQCLGLHGDTMWVGCDEGVVRVYKYNDA